MKFLLSTISVFLVLHCQSQLAIEIPEQNVLYRGYNNRILVGTIDNGFDSLLIDNGSITPAIVDGKNGFIVKPFGAATCSIYAVKRNNNTLDTVDYRVFRVQSLPKPTLYWGSIQTGGKAHAVNTKIFVKYPPSIPLMATFRVLSWELKVNEDLVKGNGNTLSDEALSTVSDLDGNQTVSIIAKVAGPDGIVRTVSGVWSI